MLSVSSSFAACDNSPEEETEEENIDNPPSLLAEVPSADSVLPVSSSQVDFLSNQALKKEVELLKLNTRYRIESTKVDRFKPWRLFGYSLAANSLIEVGLSHVAYARWKYWQRPGLATKAFLRKGPICLLTGHSIIVGGVLVESTLDAINQRRQNRKGFDRKTCTRRVGELAREIDELLLSRERAVHATNYDDSVKQVLLLEGKVLSDIKNCGVREYSQLAVRERKIKTARDTAALLTFAQAATGGFGGSLGNLLAVSNRKPRLAVPAGIGFTVSGGLITLTPLSTKLNADWAARRERRHLNSKLGVDWSSPELFDKNRTAFISSIGPEANADNIGELSKRVAIYQTFNDLFDNQDKMAKAEAATNKKEFYEKLFTNTLAGGTKMAWGLNLIVAGSDFSNTTPARAPTIPINIRGRVVRAPIPITKSPAQMFSRRVAQGATAGLAGPMVGAVDAVQTRVRGVLREHKAKKAGSAPGQILAKRLKTLEEIESKLK